MKISLIGSLCMGTNNLTKKKQTELETVKEIIDVVNKCYTSGVSEVFVSGLTERPSHQRQIDEINRILQRNASENNFEYIDNSNIQKRHLWHGDMLHLITKVKFYLRAII